MWAFAFRGCAIVFLFLALSNLASISASASDLVWKVQNPFRFYKNSDSFKIHEKAYESLVGPQPNAVPDKNIIWKIERYLNDADCTDPSTPTTCAETARNRAKFNDTRLGWAAKTCGRDDARSDSGAKPCSHVCYERDSAPHYAASCTRNYSWKNGIKEDYILPEAHTVEVTLSPDRLAENLDQTCSWKWKPRASGDWSKPSPQSCKLPFIIERVPFALDREASGATVEVNLSNGHSFSDPTILVEDLLIVALGDSFASGEGNPDQPVTFSSTAQITYDSRRPDTLQRKLPPIEASRGERFNMQELPMRLFPGGAQFGEFSDEFFAAFAKQSAVWISPNCHRSQYAYPFRVGLELALEDRHRSITLVHLACSGAQVTQGLFENQKDREGRQEFTVRPQFDQLTDLICRESESDRVKQRPTKYIIPFVEKLGEKTIGIHEEIKHWCKPEHRKRPIDLVLLSIGGNDVGFSALAAYSMMENAGDLFRLAGLLDSQLRFGSDVASVYLQSLDKWLQAVKEALQDGFGVEPARVFQTSYERIQFDENKKICGLHPDLGMNVHPKLKIIQGKLQETSTFLDKLFVQLQCMTKREAGCPEHLATGAGTGFTLVIDHQAEFASRGICAVDPNRPDVDGAMMGMPRVPIGLGSTPKGFQPYSPANFLPYAHRWRLFRTPNDAFLTANTHSETAPIYDIMQPAYAALYSGAAHPTAEAHAIVADYVMGHIRPVIKNLRH